MRWRLCALGLAPNLRLALPALLVYGLRWLETANSISISVQLSLPDWVRARGMSMFQMAIRGGGAGGAVLWGQLASLADIRTSLIVAALSAVPVLLLVQRHPLESAASRDLTPASYWSMPELAVNVELHREPVMVQFEYCIDPAPSMTL